MSSNNPTPTDSEMPTAPAAITPRVKRYFGRRALFVIAGLGILCVAVIWLTHWWTVGRFIESTDDAYLQADSVTIAPKVSGYVTEVFVADNQTVTAGMPLVQLDTRQYQAALDQAQANVAARKADLQHARAEFEEQKANIAQAQAQEQLAYVTDLYAQRKVQRYLPLVAVGAVAKDRLADLKNDHDQAHATLAADAAAVQAAQTQRASTQAQIAQAQAQLEAAYANARQAQLDVHNTVLYSPLAGRVGDRTVRVGQYLEPGTRVMTIVPAHSVYLEANFKETQIGSMRVGQPAILHVDALPGVDLHGVVDSFAPGTGAQFALLPPENATGNFTKIVQRVPVRIRLDTLTNDQQIRDKLLPGLSVSVDVDTRSARLAKPRSTAVENANG